MSIDVTGGPGGILALLDELDDAAAALGWLATRLGEGSAEVVGLALGPLARAEVEVLAGATARLDLGDAGAVGAVLARLATAQGDLCAAAGPGGALGESAELLLLGGLVAGASTAYRSADRLAAAAVDQVQDTVMGAAAVAAPVVLMAGLTAHLAGHDLLAEADATAFEHPWLVELAAGGSDGFLSGLAAANPAVKVVLVAAAARAGRPWPPRDDTDANDILESVGAMVGLLDESSAWSGVEVTPGEPRAAPAPTGVVDLMRGEVDLGRAADPGRVRVVEVPQPDGSSAWILQLPGTQVWDPRPGSNPADLSTDVGLMTQEATYLAAGAAAALDAAMARSGRTGRGDPVMLVGHSQGGILAGSLACDPGFTARHRVTDVVTMGAPVSDFPIPRTTTVLSLEHDQDPVARLDGRPNPATANWTTVRRDVSGDVPALASRAHSSDLYVRTAAEVDALVAAGGSRSLAEWSAGAAPFLASGGVAVVTDTHLSRHPRASPGALPGGGRPRS